MTNLPPEKAAVAEAFSRAADSYDAAAEAQAIIAARLADRVTAERLSANPHVLEIGCGTGLLSRALLDRIKGGHWVLTDLSPLMIERAKASVQDPRVGFHIMDGEAPDLLPGSFDLIVASLVMQWFDDLPQALARLASLLKPGGRLMFATLGADNFPEWRAAHRAVGALPGGRPLPAASDIVWPAWGEGRVIEDHVTVNYAGGQSFVTSLKAIGAHRPAPGYRPLPPGRFRQVLRSLGAPCPVTYHVLFGRWERTE